MKPGDVWKSKSSDLTFTIKKVNKNSIVVDVERLVRKGKTDPVVEVYEREVPMKEFHFFSLGYQDAE